MSGRQMDLDEVLERIDEYEARVGYSLGPLREVAEILAASSVPIPRPTMQVHANEWFAVGRPAFFDGTSVNFSAEEADVYIVCGHSHLEMSVAQIDPLVELEPRWRLFTLLYKDAAIAAQACVCLLSGDEEGFRTWISSRYWQSWTR